MQRIGGSRERHTGKIAPVLKKSRAHPRSRIEKSMILKVVSSVFKTARFFKPVNHEEKDWLAGLTVFTYLVTVWNCS